MLRRKGFTLIELLVVIAIIAILAAILFPVFAKAREKARQTSCLNNIKQMSTAVQQYVQDYDETFPAMNLDLSQDIWTVQLQPYLKNTQVLICPSNAPGVVRYCLAQAIWDLRSYPVLNLASVPNPSDKVLVADSSTLIGGHYVYTVGALQCGAAQGCQGQPDAGSSFAPGNTPITKFLPHSDGANIGYIDGHAKWSAGAAIYKIWLAGAWSPTSP